MRAVTRYAEPAKTITYHSMQHGSINNRIPWRLGERERERERERDRERER
jgi:hypothetical protein